MGFRTEGKRRQGLLIYNSVPAYRDGRDSVMCPESARRVRRLEEAFSLDGQIPDEQKGKEIRHKTPLEKNTGDRSKENQTQLKGRSNKWKWERSFTSG